ncbi:type II toxin-antitoxin system RatA family toxin [Halovulum dunhuangense]|uniref:Type II toxin-antitoxin system RatA family toxin n=1 Tax=Halovulum dunhuangense TaxID=1505036 RepID=A0A849L308_9RHOB|nr:type II toxin-antitoxin system RatA family toxin [Halovulum dunhuangense]NNU80643.1 type II toxin-antitoxin system RatA family toxin [Halovulum dunhuangense]
MPKHSENREMPYSADQLYALVADIESYPQFLPWVSAARIRQVTDIPDGQRIDADLIVSFKVFRERFGSRVTLNPEARKIDVEYLEGPFRYLNNHWEFETLGEDRCRVRFFVDFEFRSRTLQAIIGVVFNEAMQRIVRAFEARAAALYGRR